MTTKKKLILHVGLPKTGTTALQHWCHRNRLSLRRLGMDYPENVESDADPKHQFVVNALNSGNFEKLANIVAHSQCDVVFLSTEGVTNQFAGFTEGNLSAFRTAVSGCELTIFIVGRRWPDWVKSYYNQCVVNPPVAGYLYATQLSLDDFSALEQVRFLGHLPQNPALLASAFGADDVVVADYEEDWFGRLRQLLGCPDFDVPLPRRNDSLDAGRISLILEINRSGVSDGARALLLTALQRLSSSDSTIMRFYAGIPSTKADHASAQACIAHLAAKGALAPSMAERLDAETTKLWQAERSA